ncbi:MAG: hypothetical protein JWN17_3038, partial [Frankiales bacterium]|nr:hypothetical protein [Frankiales bacterium]
MLVAAAVLLRLPLLGAPPRPDEAGYLLVARHAHGGGPYLYGDLWVDRPPLLLAVFRLADALGGVLALRLLALVAGAVLVVAAADAGRTVGGRRGSWWAGLVAVALQAAPLLGAPEVDGELLAVPLVMAGIAVGLRALAPGRRSRAGHLAVAGLLAGTALLVKQNLADGLVLLGVVLVCRVVGRQVPLRRGARLLAALVGGGAAPLLAAVVWAQVWGPGPGRLWQDLVVFRSSSLAVLSASTSTAPEERAERLLLVAVLTGVVPLLALLLLSLARRRSAVRGAVAAGVLAVAAEATASVVLGGSWWTHYLVELVPACALAAALLATAGPWLRGAAGALVAAVL